MSLGESHVSEADFLPTAVRILIALLTYLKILTIADPSKSTRNWTTSYSL